MIRHILLSVLALAATAVSATRPLPLPNQAEVRVYGGPAGMLSFYVTPVPGRALGVDLNGKWAMLQTGTGGPTGVTSVALVGGQGITVTGDSPVISDGGWTLGVDPVPLKTTLALENVENTALSTWAGSTSLTTLGTIAVGTWEGAAIADAFIASAATWNAKQDGSPKLTSIAGLSLVGQTGKFLRVNAAENGYELVAQAAPVWGNITGTLSAQTDLQMALDAKADDTDLSAYLTTAAAAAGYQPLDADLTSIAGTSTTAFGRSVLTWADAAAGRSGLGLGTLATQSANISDYLTTAGAALGYQPLDADLTSIAGLATTAFGRAVLTEVSAASLRGTLELGTLATQSANISDYLTTAAASAGYQPLNSNLTNIAALTTSAFGRGLLTETSAATLRTTLELGTLATQSANIGDYLTAATAALTYQPLSGALTTFATNGSAFYLSRANHTGTQAWSTLTGTPTTLAGYGISDGITSAAVAAGYQPLDADLTSIAALTTTSFGRGLLTQIDAAGTRSTLGLGTLSTQSANISDYLTTAAAAASYQPLDTDLTSIAALATTAFGRGALTWADAAAGRSGLGLGTLATQSANISDYLTTAAAASGYQPLNSLLTSVAGLGPLAGQAGKILRINATETGVELYAVTGAGTVTSVGLSLPASVFAVSGSPVTAAGTLTATLQDQSANLIWASPASGPAGPPTFRSLADADLPAAVVRTTGSYADPAWITSLAQSKVGLSNVENTALSTWVGSTSLTTLGTITAGTWQGTAIGDSYISSAATWNSKQAGSTVLTSIAGQSLVGQTGKFLRVNATEDGYELATVSGSGSGTVTSVSVVSANGVSGSVATATTTPAITLSLGAITPTTVNGLTVTSTTGTLTVASGKTLAASNTLTFTGTDGSALDIGTGGTLGTAAFTASTAYQPADADLDTWATKTAPAGTVVGTTDAQTLTNKSIDASQLTGTIADARLPAPGVATLGGVKRNTGAAGEFVNGIDATGSLLFGTPAGGGGGGGGGGGAAGGGWEYITSTTVSSPTTAVTFDNAFTSTYDYYTVTWTDARADTEGASLTLSWRDGASDVKLETTGSTHLFYSNAIYAENNSNAVGYGHKLTYWGRTGHDAGQLCNGIAYMTPRSAGQKIVTMESRYIDNYSGADLPAVFRGWSYMATTTAMTGVSVHFAGANIISGTFVLHGLRKTEAVAQKVVNVWVASTSTPGATTAVIPFDDSIPQNTEGGEIFTIPITPLSPDNYLEVTFHSHMAFSTNLLVTLALFLDSDVDAVTATMCGRGIATGGQTAHTMAVLYLPCWSGTKTLKARIGGHTTGTVFWLQTAGAVRVLGGAAKMVMIVKEMSVN